MYVFDLLNIYILEYGRYSRIGSTTKVLEALGAENTCLNGN
jgi:hypothetical protein